MKSRILIFLAAALALGSTGCVEFRQPKEFKNRKMKEDPPLLNQAPSSPLQPQAFKPVPASLERV